VLDHLWQHVRPDCNDGRDARSAYECEHRARDDARKREAAVQMADHRHRELDHSLRHPAVGEEIAGKDEEGNGHDFPFFDAGEQLERDRFDRYLGHGEDKSQHCEAKRDRDRHAREHQGDE